MNPGTKGALVALVERRADSCRRDEVEASNLSSMVTTWAMSSITFLIGIFIATPSTLDQTWRYLSGLVLFFSTFLGFRRLDARVSKPHAALARWMAARYDTLLELYLLDSIGDKEFRECADSIRLSHARWLDMKWWARFRAMTRRSATPHGLASRLTDLGERMKFARGDMGGPGDYLG